MKVRKILAFLMVALLGANASLASAEIEPRMNAIDYYTNNTPVPGYEEQVYSEARYYGANEFVAGTSWLIEDEVYTYVEATTFVLPWNPDEGSYCPADTEYAVGTHFCTINHENFPRIIAGLYRTICVEFMHSYQFPGEIVVEVYHGEVTE